MSSARYFPNPYADFETNYQIDTTLVNNLMKNYISTIIEHTKPEVNDDSRGDLYVGDAGIAYMFLKLNRSQLLLDNINAISYAKHYINAAKGNAKNYAKRADERCAFLCGNAGIYAVSMMISRDLGDNNEYISDLNNFAVGFEACKPVHFSKYGGDEILVGRAGFLSGVYWLNQNISPPPFNDFQILEICESMVESGRQYSRQNSSPMPLMYQYHDSEYFGAAHGVCAIYHMLIESPWFSTQTTSLSETKYADIKASIDRFVELQDEEGNFPVVLESNKPQRKEKRLVHWCHGAPGAIYLLVKAYLIFREEKYLNAAKRAADLVWHKGLLYKGPGICHGVAGNGYVFLIMYRLTKEPLYLYRAGKFMEFLTNVDFRANARIPDRPFSLYEGLAGTICFLIDLLQPQTASFPFMNVF